MFIVLDEPSGFEKTYVVHKFAEANKNKRIKSFSCESDVDRLIYGIKKQPTRVSTNYLQELFDNSDCIIIEDVDIVLTGK